ncbi:uncharacterized protein F4822DRAFT_429380 [Hypoxylon trugodes]|uniref:uncharacterized protein n=1 Tax=Hypoxylon trugodes TaxID=326681 RepID=UPI00219775D9|nr:uncharacterized protein F4822DRAFT_429380 [Hypoxylon trugodes]KAI1388765.1 hypothetical protein F4822DRAFT_429380 [Hypoxylon trugodes]
MGPHSSESPAKKQTKWSKEEDALIVQLRGSGMKWDDISRRLPGRSPISCRLHYQNYLEKKIDWDEEKKNKLARLYERFKGDMWARVGEEMEIPWKAAESMHWKLGETDMAARAGVTKTFPLKTEAEGSQNGTRTSPRHAHSHSQGNISRDATTPRGYGRGGTSSLNGPLASRREAVPNLSLYPKPITDNYGYHAPHGMPLAPLKNQPTRPGMLPGVAELTTGASPYSTPAYSLPPPNVSPAPGTTASPGPYMIPMGYPPLESTMSKRRRSPEVSSFSPGMSRRRA